mmetsp:Transcript_85876/g.161705  ORF Transcript_85876/g.161705 Transcript_85876/m.161705 type:complete len:378 (-) Transcript_85876:44-1177(-)
MLMLKLLSTVCLLHVQSSSASAECNLPESKFISSSRASEAFANFKADFRRSYASEHEESIRFCNFLSSLEIIHSHNAQKDKAFEMGVNQFSDMSDEEFSNKILMKPQDCSATSGPTAGAAVPSASSNPDLPAHVDWRGKGVISEVKNQGHCGSCWTFSTIGCLEAHLAIKYDNWRAPRLSEQQLVDCAQAFDNHGCNGGLPSHAFEYVKSAGGISTEFHYPYTAKDGACAFNSSDVPKGDGPFLPTSAGVGAQVPGGSVNLTVGDEEALKYHLATHGPVSVAFQVASDFRHYSSGVYTSTVCKNGPKDVNHAVLAVGYGTDDVSGLTYWTIKNSWDYSWGVEGFFKIEAFKNMCGVADCMSFPDLYGLNSASSTVVV